MSALSPLPLTARHIGRLPVGRRVKTGAPRQRDDWRRRRQLLPDAVENAARVCRRPHRSLPLHDMPEVNAPLSSRAQVKTTGGPSQPKNPAPTVDREALADSPAGDSFERKTRVYLDEWTEMTSLLHRGPPVTLNDNTFPRSGAGNTSRERGFESCRAVERDRAGPAASAEEGHPTGLSGSAPHDLGAGQSTAIKGPTLSFSGSEIQLRPL